MNTPPLLKQPCLLIHPSLPALIHSPIRSPDAVRGDAGRSYSADEPLLVPLVSPVHAAFPRYEVIVPAVLARVEQWRGQCWSDWCLMPIHRSQASARPAGSPSLARIAGNRHVVSARCVPRGKQSGALPVAEDHNIRMRCRPGREQDREFAGPITQPGERENGGPLPALWNLSYALRQRSGEV